MEHGGLTEIILQHREFDKVVEDVSAQIVDLGISVQKNKEIPKPLDPGEDIKMRNVPPDILRNEPSDAILFNKSVPL